MKTKKRNKIWNYIFWIALIVVLFSSSLRAEVFGFLQSGMLKLGFFNPSIENVEKITESKNYSFSLVNQNGEQLNLNDLKGKVVFVNYWATWCPPCVAEMPSIHKLHQKFKDEKDVVFLMINQNKDFTKAKNYIQRKEYEFDIHQAQGKIPKDLSVFSIPTTFVLDKNGAIAYKHEGIANYSSEEFINFLKELKNQ
ncbi:TlpA family protein disulfide reductase [Mesonia maritima]|uniref:Thiol-disulfide isomerase/thioredoxin n=1 Tax=Mesonia maritima TaxID=1793873 RepID=A0ABU1K6G6_9FLAO|nr:TlpA disulfide reductase family protein [Mesonia maritima]MDR6300891.1 thiol-disulfide isomerase/thioredoxin [Mesonia maritima]